MKEIEKIDKYLDLTWELKKLEILRLERFSKVWQKTGGNEHQRKNRNLTENNTMEIGSNTQKSPGDYRKHADLESMRQEKNVKEDLPGLRIA